jgi:hypothetical protein
VHKPHPHNCLNSNSLFLLENLSLSPKVEFCGYRLVENTHPPPQINLQNQPSLLIVLSLLFTLPALSNPAPKRSMMLFLSPVHPAVRLQRAQDTLLTRASYSIYTTPEQSIRNINKGSNKRCQRVVKCLRRGFTLSKTELHA